MLRAGTGVVLKELKPVGGLAGALSAFPKIPESSTFSNTKAACAPFLIRQYLARPGCCSRESGPVSVRNRTGRSFKQVYKRKLLRIEQTFVAQLQ